jgi:hypothetical protein
MSNNRRYFHRSKGNKSNKVNNGGGGASWDNETSLYDTAQSNGSSLPVIG